MLSPMFGESWALWFWFSWATIIARRSVAPLGKRKWRMDRISAGWGFAAMAGIFTALACGRKDAHIKPRRDARWPSRAQFLQVARTSRTNLGGSPARCWYGFIFCRTGPYAGSHPQA